MCLFVFFTTMSMIRLFWYPKLTKEVFEDFYQTSYLGAIPITLDTITVGLVVSAQMLRVARVASNKTHSQYYSYSIMTVQQLCGRPSHCFGWTWRSHLLYSESSPLLFAYIRKRQK